MRAAKDEIHFEFSEFGYKKSKSRNFVTLGTSCRTSGRLTDHWFWSVFRCCGRQTIPGAKPVTLQQLGDMLHSDVPQRRDQEVQVPVGAADAGPARRALGG